MDRRLMLVALLLALVVAACGGGGSAGTAEQTAGEAAAAGPSGDGAATEAVATTGAGTTVAVATTDLGEVLVDGEGRTLYLFTNDDGAEGSTCIDDCAATWPPVTTEADPAAGKGVDEALLSTVARDDASGDQVTYGGHPLYRFAGDAAPGDTNGQGVGGVWFTVTADGAAVEGGAAEPTAGL